ncbi:NAD-dependent epimerase/dehydratase family protein [Enhygromyxa salina]|nr:NAD-dependent epimerase/dehydratase family protein [Enhygromyxa salina]
MNPLAQAQAAPLHTIFGAGQVGHKLALVLLDRGYRVRLVRRGPAGAPRQGLVWMSGDVTDPSFADEAARGAAVVYNCVNPPDYARWHGVLEPLARGVRGAATRAGARLVVLDCLYMYGVPGATPFDEDTPMRPCSSKGELRAQLVEELFEAHRRGEVEVTTGRASDYFGPDTPLSVLLNPRALARVRAGKRVEAFGDPDLPHGYSYTPDVARGLAELGTRPEAVGRAFHLPLSWAGSSRGLVERFGQALGQAGAIRAVPSWALTAVGVVSPTVRAIREMIYQWEVPYVIDDRRFCATFGVEATPIDEAIRATLGVANGNRRAA